MHACRWGHSLPSAVVQMTVSRLMVSGIPKCLSGGRHFVIEAFMFACLCMNHHGCPSSVVTFAFAMRRKSSNPSFGKHILSLETRALCSQHVRALHRCEAYSLPYVSNPVKRRSYPELSLLGLPMTLSMSKSGHVLQVQCMAQKSMVRFHTSPSSLSRLAEN